MLEILGTLVLSFLAGWLMRKIIARVQFRVGPPFYQNFIDFLKLLGKELLVPLKGEKITFLVAPLFALSSLLLVSYILWRVNIKGGTVFGDLILVTYLLMIPPIAYFLGGVSSGNPFGALGASREVKLLLADELPFVFVILLVIFKTGTTDLSQIVKSNLMTSVSGILAFLVILFCIQAKAGLVPFDMAEAETEIMGGVLVDYSGPALAVWELVKQVGLVVYPLFVITVLWGGLDGLWGILKYLLILIVMILMKAANNRIRIDQAIEFFWKPMALGGFTALVLAVVGL